jgi:hypothetical protein
MSLSRWTSRLTAELDRRDNTQHDEYRQHNELCDLERRLGLRRCYCVERRNFHERLYDCDKYIQIKGHYRSDHVHPAPSTHEVPTVERIYREQQQHERYRPDHIRWFESMERKREPC